MNLNNLKMGTRLALGFGGVLALMLLIVATSYVRLVQTESDMEATLAMERQASMADEWMLKTQLNVDRRIAIAKAAGLPELDAYFTPLTEKTVAEIAELLKTLEAAITEPKGKTLMANIVEKRQAYQGVRDQMQALLKQPDQPAAEAMLKDKVLPASVLYVNAVDELRRYERDLAAARGKEVREALQLAQGLLIGLLAASLGLGIAMAYVITRSVTRPLQEAVNAARVIAANDLSQPLDSQRKDELGELLRALGQMQGALRQMVSQVRQSTDSITNASTEIASGNQDLSSRTEQAASNLQQTASSMEQLTGTVKQSADSARQANQLAVSAAEVAARGGKVVSDVVATMDEINGASKKIADIIGVIDGIAFQTIILALNAAVEAARAGEQGRGFAVVAGEVRNLAQRSAEAAKEIKALIGASVEKVESGSKLVADAGQTMSEIVGSVQRVTDIIGEITAAAAEQSDGIGQVNTAVVQLDQMTQQNAALVEESAAAAESLRDQAIRLAKVVGTFQLDSGRGAAPAPVAVAAAKVPPASAAPKAAPKSTPAPAAKAAQPAPVAAATPAKSGASDNDWETF